MRKKIEWNENKLATYEKENINRSGKFKIKQNRRRK